MVTNMLRITLILLFCAGWAYSQRVLHVSTIPGYADIYVEELRPDHTQEPHHTSPAFIPINEDNSLDGVILISLFSPGFADTTIQVKLSDRDTSYLIVSLRPIDSEILLDKQQSKLSKRSRRTFGKKLMLSSIVPFGFGLAAGAFTYYNIHRADEKRNLLKESLIYSDDHVQQMQRDFEDYRQNAQRGKTATVTSFIIGASLLSIGFILSF